MKHFCLKAQHAILLLAVLLAGACENDRITPVDPPIQKPPVKLSKVESLETQTSLRLTLSYGYLGDQIKSYSRVFSNPGYDEWHQFGYTNGSFVFDTLSIVYAENRIPGVITYENNLIKDITYTSKEGELIFYRKFRFSAEKRLLELEFHYNYNRQGVLMREKYFFEWKDNNVTRIARKFYGEEGGPSDSLITVFTYTSLPNKLPLVLPFQASWFEWLYTPILCKNLPASISYGRSGQEFEGSSGNYEYKVNEHGLPTERVLTYKNGEKSITNYSWIAE